MAMDIDEAKVEEFLGKVVTDAGAALGIALAYIGDELGLYKAMAGAGPLTPAELAEKTGTNERMIREWLNANAAGGWVSYDPEAVRYTLPDEHAVCFVDEMAPTYLGGGFEGVAGLYQVIDKLIDAFRTGEGLPWSEQDPRLFRAVERLSTPSLNAFLVQEWIPACEGLEEKLRAGVRATDVGCGLGKSLVILGQAYPESTFVGFDAHEPSIAEARKNAADTGVADRVSFEVATAQDFPGTYDMVMMVDSLHDMGDFLGAAGHVRESLDPDGTLLLIEPNGADRIEDNLHPLGRFFYGASTMACTPGALSQGHDALGAQAGEARLRQVTEEAGFTRFRRVAESPFNIICEVRP